MRSCALALLLATPALCWVQVEEEIVLNKELRVVNEGLSTDGDSWFLTNQHVLYRGTQTNPVAIELQNAKAIPLELKERRYDHIGDISVFGGVIYGGLESSSVDTGILAAWDATTLELLRYQETSQSGMPWLAKSPVEARPHLCLLSSFV